MSISYRNKQFVIFSIITLVSIVVILFLTVNRKTFIAVAHLNVKDLLPLVFLWALSYIFDGLSIYFIVRASGEHISFYTSLQTSAIKYFFNMITPFSFGGQPVMIYYLTQKNVPSGKSSTIAMTKLMLMALWTFLGAIIAFYFYAGMVASNTVILIIFIVTSILQTIFILSIVLLMLFPQLFIGIFIRIGKLGQRFKLFKKTNALKRIVISEASVARRSFRHYFQSHIIYFFGAIIANGISYATLLLMLYFVLQGFGINFAPRYAMAFTAILFLVMGFFPTPGASGFAEGLFILFVSASASISVLGVAVIIWRFFTHYLSMFVGLFFSAKHLSGFALKPKEKEDEKAVSVQLKS